jgi:hypothetical protein
MRTQLRPQALSTCRILGSSKHRFGHSTRCRWDTSDKFVTIHRLSRRMECSIDKASMVSSGAKRYYTWSMLGMACLISLPSPTGSTKVRLQLAARSAGCLARFNAEVRLALADNDSSATSLLSPIASLLSYNSYYTSATSNCHNHNMNTIAYAARAGLSD